MDGAASGLVEDIGELEHFGSIVRTAGQIEELSIAHDAHARAPSSLGSKTIYSHHEGEAPPNFVLLLKRVFRLPPAAGHRQVRGEGLPQFLHEAGIEALEVTSPSAGDRRRYGKNDDFDAKSAAQPAFAGIRIVTPPAGERARIDAFRTTSSRWQAPGPRDRLSNG